MTFRLAHMLTALFVSLTLFTLGGCGYTTRNLYESGDIRTIAVPIFKSIGIRRDVEYVVTEQVIKKIEAKTPFKVVAEDCADTVLYGTVQTSKYSFGEDGFDNPRGGMMGLEVVLTWQDRRTGKIINRTKKPVSVRSTEPFLIDLAQSQTTAIYEAADLISENVVTLIQAPW